MSDNPERIDLHLEGVLVPDDPGDGHVTRVRCAGCADERDVPTELLPLGGRPVRDTDGVRIGLCPRCAFGEDRT